MKMMKMLTTSWHRCGEDNNDIKYVKHLQRDCSIGDSKFYYQLWLPELREHKFQVPIVDFNNSAHHNTHSLCSPGELLYPNAQAN